MESFSERQRKRKKEWWAKVKAGEIAPPKARVKKTGFSFFTDKEYRIGLDDPKRILFKVENDVLHMRRERRTKDGIFSIPLVELFQMVVRAKINEELKARRMINED